MITNMILPGILSRAGMIMVIIMAIITGQAMFMGRDARMDIIIMKKKSTKKIGYGGRNDG
jgi:ABC-type tungstate transport system permease subunit